MFGSKNTVGTDKQDMILSPHNEEVSCCNFANPQAKLEEATMSWTSGRHEVLVEFWCKTFWEAAVCVMKNEMEM
jgi:hypothetical protein